MPPLFMMATSARPAARCRSEEHTSELQSQSNLVCRLLLEKKKRHTTTPSPEPASRIIISSLHWVTILKPLTLISTTPDFAIQLVSPYSMVTFPPASTQSTL